MTDTKFLLKEIEYDKHNIQQMVNLLKEADSKGHYRSISATIKETVKSIKNSKMLIDEEMWEDPVKNTPRLFEVTPTSIDHKKYFRNISSFFGKIED